MNKYLDILILMKERTANQISAFTTAANTLHVYEGAGTEKEVTREMLDALEKQRIDLECLISREYARG